MDGHTEEGSRWNSQLHPGLENGFGDLNGEFWYGLRNLHCLTAREEVELRIDMVTKKTNTKMWWTYQTFKVAGAGDKYRLTVGGGRAVLGRMVWPTTMECSSAHMTRTMTGERSVRMHTREDGGTRTAPP